MMKVTTCIDEPQVERLLSVLQREFPTWSIVQLSELLRRALPLLERALGIESSLSAAIEGKREDGDAFALRYPASRDIDPPLGQSIEECRS